MQPGGENGYSPLKNRTPKPQPKPTNNFRTLCTLQPNNDSQKIDEYEDHDSEEIDEHDDDTSVRYCSMTLPVKIRSSTGDTHTCLAVLDTGSNKTYIDPKLIQILNPPDHEIRRRTYTIRHLGGVTDDIDGYCIRNLQIKGINEPQWLELPPTYTNPYIPDTSDSMASPNDVINCPHIASLANKFVKPDPEWQVLVLLGVDTTVAFNTQTYGNKPPFVQKTPLGYALVGPVPNESGKLSHRTLTTLMHTLNTRTHSLPVNI